MWRLGANANPRLKKEKTLNTFDKHLIRLLVVSLCYFELPISPAHAELVSTYSIAAASHAESARQNSSTIWSAKTCALGWRKTE